MAAFTIDEIIEACGAKLVSCGIDPNINGVSTDTRSIRKGNVFIALKGENFDGHAFVEKACMAGASGIIISDEKAIEKASKEVSVFLVQNTKRALEDLAHFHRMRFHIPLIAVTGSNGKTTTKDMIASVLQSSFRVCATQKNFNNEIGLSMTLLSMTKETEVCVVEMGMRGFGQIAELCRIASPTIGVVTNVGTSHIGILGSQKNIAKAKAELIEALPSDGIAILNGDDPYVKAMGDDFDGKIISYGVNGCYTTRGADLHYEATCTQFTCTHFEETFNVKLNLLGVHNVYDALAAIATARVVGVDEKKIQKALAMFYPAEQRQTLLNIADVWVMDDSYNANPLSMEMAFLSLKQLPANHRFLVLGDMGELGELEEKLHFETGEKAASIGFDGLLTVGPLSRSLAKGAQKGGLSAVCCDDCEEAVQYLLQWVKPGDAVLVKGSHYMHMEAVPKFMRGVLEKNGN